MFASFDILPPMHKIQSLHNHTTTSDGKETHLEVLKTAKRYGLDAIAFTDHDALPSEKTIENLRTYKGPVRWLAGIEISSALPKEMGGKPTSLFHIVGLFINPFEKELVTHTKKAQEARRERMQKIVENLNKLNFNISVDDCLNASGGESVGRPHITEALLSHTENHEILKDIAGKMKNEAKNNEKLQIKYSAMMKRHEIRGIAEYVYGLLLTDKSYLSDVYVDYTYVTDMDKSVSLIRNAGGIAILAHWPTVKNKIPLETVKTFLEEKRLDGIETISGTVEKEPEHIDALEKIVQETGCIRSVGIDAHKPDDFKRFTSLKGIPEKTQNTLEIMIEKTKPQLEFSNIK